MITVSPKLYCDDAHKDYARWAPGVCRDPDGKHDHEEKEQNTAGTWLWFQKCPCIACDKRRKRKFAERLAAEEGQTSLHGASSGSFLMPTRTERVASFVWSMVKSGAVIAAYELAKQGIGLL